EEAGEEGGRARVAVLARAGLEVGAEMLDDGLVVGKERRQHGARREPLSGLLREAGELRELRERAGGRAAELPGPLGDVVDDAVQLPVLRLEELVQVVELRPGHVPVEVPGLGVEDVLVGEERVQALDHARALRVGESDGGLLHAVPTSAARRLWEAGVPWRRCRRPCYDARMARRLTHLDRRGRARMVDVSPKPVTRREAVARREVTMPPEPRASRGAHAPPRRAPAPVARLPGIMAAKRPAELIPLCHPLPLSHVDVELTPDTARARVLLESRVAVEARTGVEMEALTAVAVAGLTLYHLCKAVDREMTIGAVRLVRKSGGRSGTFVRRGER